MKKPIISVIIITYNNASYIKQCLDSLFISLKGISSEVVVIDNASTDDTARILQSYTKKIRYIASKRNDGFGKAVNKAYVQTVGDYVWLLNPDAFVDGNCAKELLSIMKASDTIGVVGASMRYQNDDAQGSFGYRPVMWRELLQWSLLYRYVPVGRVILPSTHTVRLFSDSHQVSWVSGGCMLVRRSVLSQQKRMFDPRYFMYMEDVDLCLSVQNKGFEIWYCATAHVTHLHSASFGSGKGRFTFSNILEASSVLQFWRKWYPSQKVQVLLLRFLFKSKLWLKLLLVSPELSQEQKQRYWEQWHHIV